MPAESGENERVGPELDTLELDLDKDGSDHYAEDDVDDESGDENVRFNALSIIASTGTYLTFSAAGKSVRGGYCLGVASHFSFRYGPGCI